MKNRLLLLITGILLLATVATAFAEPAPDPIYELSEDQTVLTVRLPANATTGYEWNYDISNEDLLQMLTMEYLVDDAPEGFAGVGGTWVCSFTSALSQEGMAGEVTLTLSYARSWERETAPENTEGYTIVLWVMENGQISVEDVDPFSFEEVTQA